MHQEEQTLAHTGKLPCQVAQDIIVIKKEPVPNQKVLSLLLKQMNLYAADQHGNQLIATLGVNGFKMVHVVILLLKQQEFQKAQITNQEKPILALYGKPPCPVVLDINAQPAKRLVQKVLINLRLLQMNLYAVDQHGNQLIAITMEHGFKMVNVVIHLFKQQEYRKAQTMNQEKLILALYGKPPCHNVLDINAARASQRPFPKVLRNLPKHHNHFAVVQNGHQPKVTTMELGLKIIHVVIHQHIQQEYLQVLTMNQENLVYGK